MKKKESAPSAEQLENKAASARWLEDDAAKVRARAPTSEELEWMAEVVAHPRKLSQIQWSGLMAAGREDEKPNLQAGTHTSLERRGLVYVEPRGGARLRLTPFGRVLHDAVGRDGLCSGCGVPLQLFGKAPGHEVCRGCVRRKAASLLMRAKFQAVIDLVAGASSRKAK